MFTFHYCIYIHVGITDRDEVNNGNKKTDFQFLGMINYFVFVFSITELVTKT